ncbi:AP-1 adaptor complex sigma subunit Aps1 [Mitosporidium daphniae]
MSFLLLINRQSKVRLSKWWDATIPLQERQKITRDLSSLILARKSKQCNFVEYSVYKRYASLFIIAGITLDANELLALEWIQRFVESLDQYFGNVCELDLIFNYEKAYYILDELIAGGELQESSRTAVNHYVTHADALERQAQ